MTDNKKKLWVQPWNYKEGFIIVGILIIFGFILNFVFGANLIMPTFPNNIICGLCFVILTISLYLIFNNTPIFNWLTSIKFSLCIISAFTLLVLFMGFIPQTENQNYLIKQLGLNNILQSFSFAIIYTLFILVLGLVTIKRLIPFSTKNIGFLLNHLGLWLVLFLSTIGTGDIQKVKLTVNKTGYSYSGYNQNQKFINDLGIAIKLKEFKIEEYKPKLYFINNRTGEPINNQNNVIKKGNKFDFLDWQVTVLEDFDYSAIHQNEYYSIYDYGAVNSAKIQIQKQDSVLKSWISCGNFRNPPKYIELDSNYAIVMANPEPKKFTSNISILTNQKENFESIVEVNKPIDVNGWAIYQHSYDEKMGRWSEYSILELVKDPWLNYVYIGFYFLIAGSIYLIFGSKTKDNL
jgi:hypothetical protein